jgi:pseudouridine-5'-phosphate glycosidase
MGINISRLLKANQAFAPGIAVKQGAASNEAQNVAATTDVPLGIYVTPESVTAAATQASTISGAICVAGECMALAGVGGVAAGAHVVIAADGSLVAKAAAGYVVGESIDNQAAAAGEWFKLNVNIRKEPA